MMNYFFTTMLMVFSLSAMAINTNGLSEQQLAELNLQAVNMKAKASLPEVSTIEEVEKWANLGAVLGGGLAATAKELGITANEFANTPVGMVAIILIAWNYIGNTLLGVVFGFFWFSTTIPLWVWFYRSRFVISKITYYDKGALKNGVRKIKEYREGNDETVTHLFYWGTLILIVITGLVIIF